MAAAAAAGGTGPGAPLPAGFGRREGSQAWPEASLACLFGLAALLAAFTLARTGRPSYTGESPVNTGNRRRRLLVVGLLVANTARCLSLCAELALQTGAWSVSADRLEWVDALVTGLPSILFLSAFSVVVLFFVQLHWTSNIVPLGLLDCLVVCANAACYLLVATVALCTFFLRLYGRLGPYLTSLIGFLNAAEALPFGYYGCKVLSELSDTATRKVPGRQIPHRVLVLSVACPVALLARAACYLAWSMHVVGEDHLAELGLQLVCEWLPSTLALAVLNPLQRGSPRDLDESLGDSADSAEEPLLRDDTPAPARGMSSSNVDFSQKWIQIYPQPAHS